MGQDSLLAWLSYYEIEPVKTVNPSNNQIFTGPDIVFERLGIDGKEYQILFSEPVDHNCDDSFAPASNRGLKVS